MNLVVSHSFSEVFSDLSLFLWWVMEKSICADPYSNNFPSQTQEQQLLGEGGLPRQTSSANILTPQKVSYIIIKPNYHSLELQHLFPWSHLMLRTGWISILVFPRISVMKQSNIPFKTESSLIITSKQGMSSLKGRALSTLFSY